MKELKFYYKIFKKSLQFPLKVPHPVEAPTMPGVYFITEIFMGEEIIVYVGSSKWLRQRVYSHPITNKLKKLGLFGNVYVIPLPEEDYKYYEDYFIINIKPKYNKHVKKDLSVYID